MTIVRGLDSFLLETLDGIRREKSLYIYIYILL